MTAPLTVTAAASLARAGADEIRAALESGDLRNLSRRAVDAWARARVAGTVTKALRP